MHEVGRFGQVSQRIGWFKRGAPIQGIYIQGSRYTSSDNINFPALSPLLSPAPGVEDSRFTSPGYSNLPTLSLSTPDPAPPDVEELRCTSSGNLTSSEVQRC